MKQAIHLLVWLALILMPVGGIVKAFAMNNPSLFTSHTLAKLHFSISLVDSLTQKPADLYQVQADIENTSDDSIYIRTNDCSFLFISNPEFTIDYEKCCDLKQPSVIVSIAPGQKLSYKLTLHRTYNGESPEIKMIFNYVYGVDAKTALTYFIFGPGQVNSCQSNSLILNN